MFNLFKNENTNQTEEEKFWKWFVKNKQQVEQFVDSDHSNYSVYNELTSKIKKYNNILFPELTKTKEDRYVLIITPDGIKEGVAPTKKLGEACPQIENWIIQKFRQPTDEIVLNFNGVEYPSSDIEIAWVIDRENEVVDIEVFIKNMNQDKENYQSLAFLYLDHILGEFNTITKVRYINFYNLENGQTVKDSITLLQLRYLIAEELY